MGLRPFAIFLAVLGCQLLAYAETNDPLQLSVKPGVYRQDILLVVAATAGYSVQYQFVGMAGTSRFLPFSSALALGALEGETRDYRLAIQVLKDGKVQEQRELLYTIDKSIPFSPEPDLAPGTWFAPLELHFTQALLESGDRILHSWTASDGSSQVLREGSTVLLSGKSGALISYKLTAYAEDAVRHTSPATVCSYTVDRRRERDLSEIPVYSPVEGRFQNPQYLYLDNLAFAQVRYTVDGSDPRNGTIYVGGLLLEQSGRVNLRLWARTQNGKELERTIVYEAGTERIPELESGIIGQTRVVQIERETYFYAAGERLPLSTDDTLSNPLRITPQTGALRGVALRLLRQRDQAQFRYYLVLDGRQPQAPELWARARSPITGQMETVTGEQAINGDLEVQVRASEGSRVWYRLDGKKPETSPSDSLSVNGLVQLSAKTLASQAGSNGLCILVFQGRQADGSWGPISQLSVRPAQIIRPPQISIKVNPDSSVSLNPGTWNGSIWYKIDSIFHGATHAGPFRLDGAGNLVLPQGAAAQFKISYFGIDASGQASTVVQSDVVNVSNLPPAEPLIQLGSDHSVSILGSGIIRYRVLADNAAAPSASNQAQTYTKPFPLKELANGNVRYVVEAWTEDSNRKQSSVVQSDPVYFHARAPTAASVSEGGAELYRNTRAFTLSIAKPESGMRYLYAIGALGTVVDPGMDSRWTLSDITVQAAEKDQDLELRIKAVSSVRPDLVSPVSRIIIHVMTRLPDAPLISGVEAGAAYNHPLEISLSSAQPGAISYRLAEGAISDQTPWQDYRQAIRLAAIANLEQEYQFQARIQDRAGNMSLLQAPMVFRIITRIPALSPLHVQTADGEVLDFQPDNSLLSRANLQLTAITAPGLEVHYALVDERNSLRLPDASAQVLKGELVLPADMGDERTWNLQYRVVDSAGNASIPSPVYTITIDRRPPVVPEPPQLNRQGNAGSLSWLIPDDADIEYFFSNAPQVSGIPDFHRYTGERVAWSLGEDNPRLFLNYRSRDAAGNTSELKSLLIEPTRHAAVPQLAGVVDGGLYRGMVAVSVEDASANETVRYELTIGDQNRIEASAQSSIMPAVLEISPLAGETVSYHLSVRKYVDGQDPSEILNLSFTIDRTPPRSPDIRSLDSVTYSSGTLEIHFEADPGDKVWYCLQADVLLQTDDQKALSAAQEKVLREQAVFKSYGQEAVRLQGQTGKVIRYLILARTIDAAGNQSQLVPFWQVFIDGDSVYVSDQLLADKDPSSAGNLESGSRTQPFHDIGTALNYAIKNGKRSLRLGAGRFVVNQSLLVPEGMLIAGGYQTDSWETNGKNTTILYPRVGFAEPYLIQSERGIGLKALFLADAGIRLKSMVRASGGTIRIDGCNLAVTLTSRGLDISNATLEMNNSLISCNDPLDTDLLYLDSSQCRISSSVLESADLPSVLLKNQGRADYRLIKALSSFITIEDSDIHPRRGQSTCAVWMRGGSFTMRGKSLSAGGGTISASVLDADENAIVNLSDVVCKPENNAGNTVLFRIHQTDLTIKGATLVLASLAGVYGIMAEDSTVQLASSEILGGRAVDFMTMISAKSSHLKVADCQFSGSETLDLHVASLIGGESTWTGNTIQIKGGGSESGLFFFSLAGSHDFSGNTFTGDDQHTLFYLGTSDGSLAVRSNILEHWRFILQEASEQLSRQSDRDKGINSLQILESTRRQGSLFEGNKIRQGL